jgi:pimeloyl-ACP methyl ester carboxylesterase
MPNIQVSTGISLYYEWHGDEKAPPLVLIRGTGGVGSRWMPQVESYASRYRCLIFDNRGAGQSDSPPPPYSVEDLASDTVALMDALEVNAAHVSGLSLGGAIAQVLTATNPDRVQTLQLHGSWGSTHGYAHLFFSLLMRYLRMGGLDFYFDAAPLLFFSPDFFTREYDQALKVMATMKEHSPTLEGLEGQIAASLEHDATDRLSGISAPTLITAGQLDMCLPPLYARELENAIPGSELVVFEGGSHLFCVEDPAVFNRITMDWLDSHS